MSGHEMEVNATSPHSTHISKEMQVGPAEPDLRDRASLDAADLEPARILETVRKGSILENRAEKQIRTSGGLPNAGYGPAIGYFSRSTNQPPSSFTPSASALKKSSQALKPRPTLSKAEIMRQGRLGPNMPIPISDHATAMTIYNNTLTEAKTRHRVLQPTNLSNDGEFDMDDVQDAIAITNLHKGWAISVEDLIRTLDDRGEQIEYTCLDLIQAVKDLWQIDYLYLVTGCKGRASEAKFVGTHHFTDVAGESASSPVNADLPVEVEMNGEEVTNITTRTRRVSPRESVDRTLKYDASYHPIDEFLRPSKARKLKATGRKGRVG